MTARVHSSQCEQYKSDIPLLQELNAEILNVIGSMITTSTLRQ